LFLLEIWEDSREIVKVIATDILLFLLVLVALFVGHLILEAMRRGGYPPDQLTILESLDYWAYLSAKSLFAVDLLVKLVFFLFLARKRTASD